MRVGSAVPEAEPRPSPEPAAEPAAPVAGQLAFFDELAEVEPLPPPQPVEVPPPLVPLPAAPPERPGRLSFSALSLFARCSYRFYAERLLGFRAVDGGRTPGGEGLDGAELGTVVHDTLEHPGRGVDVALPRFPHATAADVERAAALVGDVGALAARAAAAGARGAPRGAVPGGGGRRADRGPARPAGARRHRRAWSSTTRRTASAASSTPAEIRDEGYALQEAVYALALLEHGHDAVEVHFAFLDADEVVSAASRRTTRTACGRAWRWPWRRPPPGPYVPRPGVVCEDCPVLGLLCAGPDLDALHAAPDAY